MAHNPRLSEETPSAAEYTDLITYLAQQGSASAQEIRQLLGAGPNDRSRRDISQDVTSWLADRPKS